MEDGDKNIVGLKNLKGLNLCRLIFLPLSARICGNNKAKNKKSKKEEKKIKNFNR